MIYNPLICRLLTYGEIDIAPGSWKRITLGAILLASKVIIVGLTSSIHP